MESGQDVPCAEVPKDPQTLLVSVLMWLSFVLLVVGFALPTSPAGRRPPADAPARNLLAEFDAVANATPAAKAPAPARPKKQPARASGVDQLGPSISDRIRYQTDLFFGTHKYARVTALLLVALFMVFIGGVAHQMVDSDRRTLASSLWMAYSFVSGGGSYDEDALSRIVQVLLSFGGMLLFALLVGMITEAINERMEEMRRGRNKVLESGHLLICGWNDKVAHLVDEISLANESCGGGTIVVLNDSLEKEAMDEAIKEPMAAAWKRRTRVITRVGDCINAEDLRRVQASRAKTIVVLSDIDDTPSRSDAKSIRAVLSLVIGLRPTFPPIVVEMRDIDNLPLLRSVEEVYPVAPGAITAVVPHDITGRLMVQCTIQPGLAEVYTSLLGFRGDEFYFKHWPQLTGKTFGDALYMFRDAVPLGVRRGGRVHLCPEDGMVLTAADELLVLAEDDDSYAPSGERLYGRPGRGAPPASCASPQKKRAPETVLVIGWRRDLYDLICELDTYLPQGSELILLAELPLDKRERELTRGKFRPDGGAVSLLFDNLQIKHSVTTSEENAEKLRVALDGARYAVTSILILVDETMEGDAKSADSLTIATLLCLRRIYQMRGTRPPPLMAEILESQTRALLTRTDLCDHVMSTSLIARVLAMVAEEPGLTALFEELFSEEGVEICVRPAREYVAPGRESVSFWELSRRARKCGDIAIGYKIAEGAVTLNPPKDEPIRWEKDDRIIILGDKI